MKKSSSVFLTALLALSLAGCGSQIQNDTDPSAENVEQSDQNIPGATSDSESSNPQGDGSIADLKAKIQSGASIEDSFGEPEDNVEVEGPQFEDVSDDE